MGCTNIAYPKLVVDLMPNGGCFFMVIDCRRILCEPSSWVALQGCED